MTCSQTPETANQNPGSRSKAGYWLALPPLVFAAVVYFPITRNYFYLDDFLNLYHIVNDSPLNYLFRENGGHVLLSRNALFYLTFQLAGPRPEPFLWSALITHLLNVGLLFAVIYRLTGRSGLACFGSGLWGSSPLQEGTLGWYSVFGHAMVGTTLLVILATASRTAQLGRQPSRRLRYLWGALALIGVTSFGTGIGVAMALPFVLALLLPPPAGSWRRPPLLALVLVVPLVYVALTRLYEITAGEPAPVRSIAGGILSSLAATASTATRIAGAGVSRWLMSFYYPATMQSREWIVVLALFSLFVAGAMLWAAPPRRRQLAACVLLALSCYGIISVARSLLHVADDSVIAALTRYHYVPSIALTILLCLILARCAEYLPLRVRGALLLAWYGAALAGYTLLGPTIDHHETDRQDTREVLRAIQSKIDDYPPGATVRIPNAPFRGFPLYGYVPGWAAVFTMFHSSNVVDGRQVVFVERHANVRAAHQDGRRIGKLLVAPEPAGGRR